MPDGKSAGSSILAVGRQRASSMSSAWKWMAAWPRGSSLGSCTDPSHVLPVINRAGALIVRPCAPRPEMSSTRSPDGVSSNAHSASRPALDDRTSRSSLPLYGKTGRPATCSSSAAAASRTWRAARRSQPSAPTASASVSPGRGVSALTFRAALRTSTLTWSRYQRRSTTARSART